MWQGIPKQRRKDFMRTWFLYIPVGLGVGLSISFILIKAIFSEVKLSAAIFTVISTVLVCIILMVVNYRQLIKESVDKKDDLQSY
jgi:hypothetical protein